MAIAYLVTTGSYSDYRVKGVFLDPNEAERAKILWAADNDVEKYEIGAMPAWTNDWTPWRVSMLQDGNNASATPENVEYFKEGGTRMNIINSYGGTIPYIFVFVAAKTEEHAIKVANEKRIQWLAAQ